MQNAVVIYETLTGNTRRAGERIARELQGAGVSATACPLTHIDYPALAAADVVIVGTWTDGLVLFGQRPGRGGRIWMKLPAIDRKLAALYCTYAVAPGKTLEKLGVLVSGRGGDVLGGYAIKRTKVDAGAATFAERLVDAASAHQGAAHQDAPDASGERITRQGVQFAHQNDMSAPPASTPV